MIDFIVFFVFQYAQSDYYTVLDNITVMGAKTKFNPATQVEKEFW